MLSRTRKILLTAVVVGGTTAFAGAGVFAAFTATTTNTGNSIASGTVAIGSTGGTGNFLYQLPNQGPGATTQRCIRVTYSGSLGAQVKMYRGGTVNNGTAFNLQVERGTGLSGSFPSCTGFTAAATLYNGTLGAFPTTYAAGPDARSGTAWAQNDVVDYRISVSVVDDPTPGAHATPLASGSHSFTWEARNN